MKHTLLCTLAAIGSLLVLSACSTDRAASTETDTTSTTSSSYMGK
jgi:hypothetical protein